MKQNNTLQRMQVIIAVIKHYKLLTQMTPTNLRKAFEDLGPTFIKLGQIMADREDMLSEDYCNELRKLRSQVNPMDSATVKRLLKKELKLKYNDFTSISPLPIGSASIAQIHKARLHNKLVVIKIERENIREAMETDIFLLKKLIKYIPIEKLLHNSIDVNNLLDELLESSKNEMDFTKEEQNMVKFKQNNDDVSYIDIPEVYEEYTTKNLLVMDYIDAPKINDVKALEYYGYNMKDIAFLLAKNYIKQALIDGFYHADPHPDNIKIKSNKIVYLDFGMMGTLKEENKKILKDCMENIIFHDTEQLAHNIVLFGNTEDVNIFKLQLDLEKLLDVYLTKGIGEIDLKDFAPALLNIIKTHHIKLPKDITLLIRGIVIIEGVLEDIDPDISLLEALKSQYQITDVISKEKIEKTIISLLKNSNDLTKIPSEILKFYKNLNEGTLKLEESSSSLNQKDTHIKLILLGILDMAFILSIAICTLGNSTLSQTFTILFFFCFILNTIYLIIKFRK